MILEDIICISIELLLCILLFFLAGYANKVKSSKWKICYVLPLIIIFLFLGISGFEWCMAGAYIGAAVVLFGFIKEDVKTRRWVSEIGAACVVVTALLCNTISGYRAPDYEKDFQKGFQEMKSHYVLAEQKKIDWDALYEKYLPIFEEVNKNHDEVAATIAWLNFSMEFSDGHVTYSGEEDVMKEALTKMWGNDYGLALMTLSDGRTVAVNVEDGSKAQQSGIHNGTEITSWDKMSIEDAIEKTKENGKKLNAFASKENEKFYDALLVAGTEKEEVVVSYIDDAGKEKEIVLENIGSYYERWKECIETIDKGVEISNLDWQEIDETSALMRMRFMSYDSKANYAEMESQIRTKLLELKEKGVTNLIFDLRSNGGGSGSYVKHILKLIAPEGEHVYAYDGVFDTKTMKYETQQENSANTYPLYKVGECETYQGENLWSHGKILLLVNAQAGSAADHFTKLAAEYPNVEVMGFTHTNCSAQGLNGVSFSYGTLSYSGVLILKEDGSVFIDTDETRTATVLLDIQIPFDKTAVKIIFDEKKDYVLGYAMDYSKEK